MMQTSITGLYKAPQPKGKSMLDHKRLETIKQAEQEALLKLDQPSLQALAYLLRHREKWPKDFSWDFGYCNRCAMGLAAELWGKIDTGGSNHAIKDMAKVLGMPLDDVKIIFGGYGTWTQRFDNAIGFVGITPEMVADQIDLYLTRSDR